MVASKKDKDVKTDDLYYGSDLMQYAEVEPDQGEDAFDKSGKTFELNEASPFLLVLLDYEEQVEEISFVTKGNGKVKMEMTDEDSSVMVKVKSTNKAFFPHMVFSCAHCYF